MADRNEGWARPVNARKFHYYVNGRSLCGKWMLLGGHLDEDEGATSSDDCKACARKMEERRQTAQGDTARLV